MDVFAADHSSGGAIALVAVGAVGAMAMALLAKTIGEEMLAWDKLSSARRRASCSAQAGRWEACRALAARRSCRAGK